MIEKSPDLKMYEKADSLLDQFRASVRNAQERARNSGVDYTFTSNGIQYIARPNGEINKLPTANSKVLNRNGEQRGNSVDNKSSPPG